MRKPAWLLLIAPVAIATGFFAAGITARADSGRLSALYQGYSSATGQDPYANSNPKDVHVGGYGGQPGVTGYVRLNFDSLPPGSTINGLRLSLTPNGSTTDNVNSGAAAFEACVLTAPLTSDGFQSNPPASDCSVHAAAEPQADGTWAIELSPLAARWEHANTGLALVAYASPNGTPVSVDPSAWSVAFARDRTGATIDYTPGSGSSSEVLPPLPAEPIGGASVEAPPAIAPVVPLPNLPPPAAAPAPAAPSPSVTQPRGSGPVVVSRPKVAQQWLWVTGALAVSAVLLLLVGAGQQAFRGGRFDPGAVLAAARSQMATPVSVLSLAAVFSLGATTQLVPVVESASGPGSSAGGLASGGVDAGTGAAGNAGGGIPGTGGALAGTSGSNLSAGVAGQLAAGARNGPGVSSSTVRLGFMYTVNGSAANSAFGFKTPNTGNQQGEEQALVDYVNHHGGIAGRQIQPVYLAYDNAQAESDPTINETNCHQMTEDYHVFAVIGGAGPPDDIAANACYAAAGTMNFDLQNAEPDLGFLRQASPYIWLGTAAALDRMMRMEITGLQQQGYFAGAASRKYGVVVAQDPTNDAIYDRLTLPALHAAGATNVEKFDVPHDTVSDIANTIKQAVARFQLDGVKNVMFQGGGNYGTGSYAALFMINAESQHYTPRYGLSSDDGPVGLAPQVPEDQLKDALAVGISPIYDTDDQHYAPWPYTPNEKKCADIEAAAGNSFQSRLNAGVELFFCQAMFELQQGAQPLAGGPLNAQLWADQAMRLGGGVYNGTMYRPFVGPDHWDIAGGYRLLHAVQNCEGNNACFVYDNANIYG